MIPCDIRVNDTMPYQGEFQFLGYLQDEVFAFLTKFSGDKIEEDDDGRVSPTTTVNTWLWRDVKEDKKSCKFV